MADAITNPLYGVETGSIVDTASGRLAFRLGVLKPGLTKLVAQHSMGLSMTGNSDYLYTDTMNQGSLGVSGSYGLSGAAKVAGAVTAYVGTTHSENSKTLAITLNCVKAAGVEYIDFDNLQMAQLIAGLKANVQADLNDVLAKFTAAQSRPVDGPEVKAWVAAVDAFTRDHGTGIVIATLWGGCAAAELKFTTSSSKDKWVYGGSAEFSYAGTGASVDVSATYGGSKQTLGDNASATVNVYSNGKCVDAIATSWYNDLKDKASKGLDAVGSAPVSSPALSGPVTAPKAPDFVAPKKDATVASRITQIKDLAGLEAFAQASAYDDYKKGGGKKDLAGFLAEAKENNEFDALQKKLDAASSLLDDLPPRNLTFTTAKNTARDTPPAEPKAADFSEYEPMGVWIANWSQLFPWFVTGHSNAVPSDTPALEMIKLRRMQQDFLTLAKLYRRFARLQNARSDFFVQPMTDRITFDALADSFATGAEGIADFIRNTGANVTRSSLQQKISDQHNRLNSHAKVIYDAWDTVGLFRKAELGLGIVVDVTVPDQPSQSISGFASQRPNLASCAFEPRWENDKLAGNFEIFAGFVKGWPLIFTDDRMRARMVCYVEGPDQNNCGILAQDAAGPHRFYVWHNVPRDTVGRGAGNDGPIEFDLFLPEERLFGVFKSWEGGSIVDNGIALYPIPYKAAEGIKWTGQSMATGDGTLGRQLTALAAALGSTTRWSFDSDYWQGRTLGDDGRFRMQRIKPSYMGLIDEPRNIFGSGD